MKPRLLAMELWGLGDLAIATPFLQAAVEKYEVTLLARPFAQELRPHFWPEVEVLPFTAPWTAFHGKYQLWRWPWREIFHLRRELRARAFDFAISARWDPRDHLALKWSGARERLGFPRLNSRHYLTRALIRPSPLAHRYESWRVAGAALGLNLPSRAAVFDSSVARPPMVLIHSGARLPLRVWPLENFREIIRRLRAQNLAVQIVCDADQVKIWQSFGETVACPRSVTELVTLFGGAGVFIGNDSGPGHLAAACGVPTFTLFGPQLHEWFAPLHPAAEVMEGKPCSDYCRFAKPFCLHDITVAEAWPKVETFVKRHLASTNQTTLLH